MAVLVIQLTRQLSLETLMSSERFFFQIWNMDLKIKYFPFIYFLAFDLCRFSTKVERYILRNWNRKVTYLWMFLLMIRYTCKYLIGSPYNLLKAQYLKAVEINFAIKTTVHKVYSIKYTHTERHANKHIYNLWKHDLQRNIINIFQVD